MVGRGELDGLRRFFGGGPRPVICDVCGGNPVRILEIREGQSEEEVIGCERCVVIRRQVLAQSAKRLGPPVIRTIEIAQHDRETYENRQVVEAEWNVGDD